MRSTHGSADSSRRGSRSRRCSAETKTMRSGGIGETSRFEPPTNDVLAQSRPLRFRREVRLRLIAMIRLPSFDCMCLPPGRARSGQRASRDAEDQDRRVGPQRLLLRDEVARVVLAESGGVDEFNEIFAQEAAREKDPPARHRLRALPRRLTCSDVEEAAWATFPLKSDSSRRFVSTASRRHIRMNVTLGHRI
jgi:hypothetical protein